jgi:hypothetical protein
VTAVLVTASNAKDFMRVTATADDTLIQGIVDATEQTFLIQAGRKERPFATAATGRVEVLNGTGTPQLMLDYPIASITSVKLGLDASSPEETLDATDVDVLVFATGKRAIYRTDGGVFRDRNEPRSVQVTYNHDADAPDFPKVAIKRAVAQVYRQIGSEDAKSESLPNGYNRTLAQFAVDDPIWNIALDSMREPSVA